MCIFISEKKGNPRSICSTASRAGVSNHRRQSQLQPLIYQPPSHRLCLGIQRDLISKQKQFSVVSLRKIFQVSSMLKVPDHQVAGHRAGKGRLGPLVDDSGRFYKPLQSDERGANEVSFYTSFSSNTKIPDHITRFFPKFSGTQLVEASDGSGKQPHLVLHDLTFDRVNPSVMDIKIGSRTWAPQSPEDYVQKCLKKDRASSSLPLGFRVSGVQIFEGAEAGTFWKVDKSSIQRLSADEIRLLLRRFVSSNGVVDMKPDCTYASTVYGGSAGILSQLLELKAWFEDQTMYHLYACSILMMFEKELASSGKGLRAEIKLVDFAHVSEGRGVIDHNFLGGLCSLIKFISEILTTPQDFASENGLV